MTELVAPLHAALRDESDAVKGWAALALKKVGKAARVAIPELAKLAGSPDRELRKRAVEAIGAAGADDPEAQRLLVELTGSANVDLAYEAAAAMREWSRLPVEVAGPVIRVMERLPHYEWRYSELLTVLGRLERPTPEVLALLRPALADPNYYRYTKAGEAVAALGEAAAELLPDVVRSARRGSDTAAHALARMGEPGIRHLAALAAEPGIARDFALGGLARAGPAALGVLPQLREDLRSAGLDYHASRVAHAIRAMGPEAHPAIPEMLPLLKCNVSRCHQEVVEALEQYGAAVVPFIPRLVEVLRDADFAWGHAGVVRLLGALAAHTDVLAPLRQALRHEKEQARRAAAVALGNLRAAAAVPDLVESLRDPGADVRREAAAALGKVRDRAAVAGLTRSLCDDEEAVRARAAEALGLIGDGTKDAIEGLLSALKDDSPRVRREAASALGRLKPDAEPVRAALEKACGDEDRAVAAQAKAALKKVKK
jgi:HEAT repeat protein